LKVFICLIDPADVSAASLGIVDDHAVTAYQPIDQRLDVDGTQSNFTIADDNAGLYDVTGYNFGFKPLVDYLDVHTAVRDLAAFKIGVLHLLNDRKDDFCNVQIVNAAIAVAQKRPYSAIQGADHTLGRFPLEPGIHILRQQFRIIGKHTVIVSSRNLQMCADLPMGDLVDLQWLHQWVIMVVKGMEIKLRTKRFYLKSPGIKQIVLLEFGLAFNLLCHFHDGKS